METESPFAHSAHSARSACGDAAAAGSSSRRTVLAAASMAAVLLLVACGTSPSRGRRGAAPGYAYSRLTPEQSSDIAIHAMGLVGTPYRYGGNTPEGGFDCSGLIGYVYRSLAGIPPPRTVAQLSDFGAPVPAGDERTGDLVIFGSGRPTHAGIVVEGGRFVHAPSTGGTVKLDRFSSGYWSRQPIAFRRP